MLCKFIFLLFGFVLEYNIFSQKVIVNITFKQATRLSIEAGADKILDNTGQILLGENIVTNGGTPDYQYFWRTADNDTINGKTIDANKIGKYFVIITDANKCTAIDSITVKSSTAISQYGKITMLNLFPNPTNEIVKVKFQNFKFPVTIEVISILGESLFFEKLNSIPLSFEQEIHLTHLKGTYYVRITGDDGFSESKPLIIK